MWWEAFKKWLKEAQWSIWFGRFLAIIYPLILGIKFTYALTIAGAFPLPVVFLLASIATVFNMACFWLVVPYLCKKLFSESLTDETIQLTIDGKDETYKVINNGKNVKVTWGARLLIYAVSAGVLVTAIGTAGIAISAFIPTLAGFGLNGIAHLSAASTLSLFAPLAVIIIISYAALALKDVTELLSRENLKETIKRNIRSALGQDAAEKFPNDLKAQKSYQHRQWAVLGLTLIFVALGILGTFTTASIGLEIVTKTFNMTALEPFLVAYAVVSMVPFLWKTLYQFSDALFRGCTAVAKLYREELQKDNATPLRATMTCMKYICVKAVWSVAFYVGLAGTVNAFCQGFIASLHYPELHTLNTDQQADASFRLIGQSSKYQGLAVKTAEGWSTRGIAPTKTIYITTSNGANFNEDDLINDLDSEKITAGATKRTSLISARIADNEGKQKDISANINKLFTVTEDGHLKKKPVVHVA